MSERGERERNRQEIGESEMGGGREGGREMKREVHRVHKLFAALVSGDECFKLVFRCAAFSVGKQWSDGRKQKHCI